MKAQLLVLFLFLTSQVQAQPVKVWEKPIAAADWLKYDSDLELLARSSDGAFVVQASGSSKITCWFDSAASFFLTTKSIGGAIEIIHVSANEMVVVEERGDMTYFARKNDQLLTQSFGNIGIPRYHYQSAPQDRENYFSLTQHDGNVYLAKWRFQTPQSVGTASVGISKTGQGLAIEAVSPSSAVLDTSTDLKNWHPVSNVLGDFRLELGNREEKEFFRLR